ncbi:MAG: DNA modification methylase [Promethearchaeota archaeon CR_4]|nr:MAG: DNA modification methylase [Candidatus Lokiarchaeota archaeon CR_4]
MEQGQPQDQLEIENQVVYYKSSEIMAEIADGSIDVIVTSPPYNRKKNYSSDNNDAHNDDMPEQDYLEFLKRVWKDCLRVASEKAVFFLNIGDSATDQGISEKVVNAAEEVGWHRIQDIIWVKSIYGKGHYTPTGSNKRFNNIWEHINLLVKNVGKYEVNPKAIGIPYADKSNIGRYGDEDLRDPGNVWHICYEMTTGATIKKGHDAPFPIGLPFQCIKVVPDARTVLDPFLGTGTTLAAALKLGIKGYGYEKYPRKELIQSTIASGRDYEAKPVILIPHYEETIGLLVEMQKNLSSTLPTPKSKRERDRFLILKDTLERMGLKTNLIKKLDTAIGIFDMEQNVQGIQKPLEKKKGQTLDQFLDGK